MSGSMLLLLAAALFTVQVAAMIGDESYEFRRQLVKTPEGLIKANEWLARVEGTPQDCARVKAEIEQLKKKRSGLGAASGANAEDMSMASFCMVYFTGDEEFKNEVLNTIEDIVTIEPDMVVHAEQQPESWGLDRIDQESLPLDQNTFEPSYTGAGITIYVVDTGINKVHNDFGGRAEFGGDFINENNKADMNGHGTHCAGTAGGTKYGVATDATLVGVKVLSAGGSGSYSGVIQGITWAVNDANGKSGVISMSLGGGKHQGVNDAVKSAAKEGMIVVVAGGNENQDACKVSPASAGGNGKNGGVITVGSTTDGDYRSSFSNWGKCTDIFAPGSQIKSAWIGGKSATNTISGTSMATPHVAGVAAVLLEKHQGNKNAAQNDLFSLVVSGKVKNKGQGSPNLLLQVPTATGPPTPPTVSPTPPPSMEPPKVCVLKNNGDELCFDYESSTFGLPMPETYALSGPLKIADGLLCNSKAPSDEWQDAIVLVRRGDCYFYDKVMNAYQQGAQAVIIHMSNGDPIFPPAYYDEDMLTIPSVMISLKDAETLKKIGEGRTILFGAGTPPPTFPTPTIAPTPPTSSPTNAPTPLFPCPDLRKRKPCMKRDHCTWNKREKLCEYTTTEAPSPPTVPAPTAEGGDLTCSFGSLSEARDFCGGNLCTYQQLVAMEDYGDTCGFLETKFIYTDTPCETKKGKQGAVVYRKTKKTNGKTSCALRVTQKRFHVCCPE